MNNETKQTQQRISDAFTSGRAATLFRGRQTNPEGFDAVATKMVAGETTDAAARDSEAQLKQETDLFIKGALAASLERIRDSRNTIQLLPDIKQVLEIMIGAILSPKDMLEPTLTYRSKAKEFTDTATPLLNYVKNYFKSSYKLEEKLDEILWDIFGYTGSYPMAVLPETTVDYMINSNTQITVESLTTVGFSATGELPHTGLLGNPNKGATAGDSFENFNVIDFLKSASPSNTVYDKIVVDPSLNISAVDNFDILKMPAIKRSISEQATHAVIAKQRNSVNSNTAKIQRANGPGSFEALRIADTEDYTKKKRNTKELLSLYPDRQFVSTPILRVKPSDVLERDNIGHPKIMKFPTESVIPIYNPMNPRDHVAYYVLIDQSGFACRFTDIEAMYNLISTSSNAMFSGNAASYLLQQSALASDPNAAGATSDINEIQSIQAAIPVFQEQIERDLMDRISNGRLGSGYAMGNMDSVTTIMLSRALMGKHTQLLYIPAELLTYMAVDYDDHGLGKTLLDDSKLLAAFRSLDQMVNSIAATKNAITKRAVNIKLAPTEKNPEKAVRMMMQEFVKGTQGEYPLTNSPADQINYIQRAGIQLKVEDHPRYPNSEFTIDYIDNQYKEINTEYGDKLRDNHIRSLGFSPELINNNSDFATTTIFANVLTNRRLRNLSNKVTPNLSDFVRKYTYNSSILFNGLVELIESNKIRIKRGDNTLLSNEEVATLFIESIEITLPKADTTQMKEQKEALEMAKEFYTLSIEQFFNSEWMTEDMLGRLGGSENIDAHKSYILSHWMREWMKENGVATELFDMLSVDRDGQPLIDFEDRYADYLDIISKSMLPFFKRKMVRNANVNANLDNFEEKMPNKPDDGGFGGGDGGFGDGGSDDGEGDGGMDDLDMGDDFPDDPTDGDDGTSDTDGDGDNGDNDDANDTDANGKDSIV